MSTVTWTEHGTPRSTRWHSEHGAAAPARIAVVGDEISTSTALRLARAGVGLLWRGDFQNARHLLNALRRRLAKSPGRAPRDASPRARFRAHRAAQSERAALLGRLMIELEHDHQLRLRRAPDVRAACTEAYGEPARDRDGMLVSLPELLGVLGAHQWQLKGIDVPVLGARIHPAYGVFAPTRQDYLDLAARARLPTGIERLVAFDLGTGTGVIAALLARRRVRTVLATDVSPRAVRCARQNLQRLGLSGRVRVSEADLWPGGCGRADLIVCNPPWLPGRPTSTLELGIYDPGSAMLNRFLAGLPDRLTRRGEGWLIMSDLAERLGLRAPGDLPSRIAEAGLEVVATDVTTPRHPRSTDRSDPLHAARAGERVVLWRLRRARA